MKKELNKWQFFFRKKDWYERPRNEQEGWRYITFGIVKIVELPEEGDTIEKKHYKGVWIHLDYWLPFKINFQ